ncbi:hypothetical protein NDU88_006827 [Pleurodeles waltl]|uniref:Secreted protein n=1 Tax=Pleurodeles waltl TaxID=8319 RepID=A0AAV7N0K0_PLEWA|nr:hypothetical protein NDU88_006827 [Pleurodeles waltl]
MRATDVGIIVTTRSVPPGFVIVVRRYDDTQSRASLPQRVPLLPSCSCYARSRVPRCHNTSRCCHCWLPRCHDACPFK